MPRPVTEWIGKNPETPAPPRVKARILRRQDFKCAITGIAFAPGETPEFDHIVAMINGGENRESNLRAIRADKHREKTKRDIAIKAHTEALTKAAFGLKSPKKKIPQRPKPAKPEPRPVAVGRSEIARRFGL